MKKHDWNTFNNIDGWMYGLSIAFLQTVFRKQLQDNARLGETERSTEFLYCFVA